MVEFSMNLEFWSLWDINKRNEYSYIINLGKHGTNDELIKLRWNHKCSIIMKM